MKRIITLIILFLTTIISFSQQVYTYDINVSIFNADIKESNIHIYNIDSDIILSGDFFTNNKHEFIWIEPRNGYSITINPNDSSERSSTVGITDDDTLLRNKNTIIKIYPNPTSNTITITTKEKITSLGLYDNYGIKQKAPVLKTNNTVNLTRYAKGVYLLKIYLNNGKILTKIIVKQ